MAISPLLGDPAQFGRVGEDGTVFVRTSSGEKAVGSYPGKTSEEALAYFVRKFEAFASEVVLLADRIKSGAIVPSDAAESIAKLRAQLTDFNGVGNLDALSHAIDELSPLVEASRPAYEAKKVADAAAKAERKAQTQAEKEKIVAEAESLGDSEKWKETGDRLKALLDEWKSAPRLDKATDSELWKRFSASRNKFDKRRRQHFAQLETLHAQVSEKKKLIVAEAETLATSQDWVNTARRYKALMDQWKAAGRGKKSDDTKLWERFKKSQDAFFAAKGADLEKRGETMSANLAKREEMITKFEALLPISDVKVARKEFNELSRAWEKIGMTQREKRASLDARVKNVEKAIKEIEAEIWRKSDPAAKARAQEVVQQLNDAIANYEKVAAKAEASGDAKRAKDAKDSAAARRVWLAEAEKNLAEFS